MRMLKNMVGIVSDFKCDTGCAIRKVCEGDAFNIGPGLRFAVLRIESPDTLTIQVFSASDPHGHTLYLPVSRENRGTRLSKRVSITVLAISKNRARIGMVAPKNMRISRYLSGN